MHVKMNKTPEAKCTPHRAHTLPNRMTQRRSDNRCLFGWNKPMIKSATKSTEQLMTLMEKTSTNAELIVRMKAWVAAMGK